MKNRLHAKEKNSVYFQLKDDIEIEAILINGKLELTLNSIGEDLTILNDNNSNKNLLS